MTTTKSAGTQRALLAITILAAVAPAGWAQTNNMHKITVLGRVPASAMHVPPLTTAKSLSRMLAVKRMPGDFRKALELAGLGSSADAALATLTSPSSVVNGGDCSTVDIPRGAIADCSVSPGATMEWMAYRKRVGKSARRDIALMSAVEWAGKRAFKAFAFDVVSTEGTMERTYRFLLPKPCSNLALLRKVERDTRPPTQTFNLTPSVTAACDCANGKLTTTVRVTGAPAGLERIRVMVDGQPAGELTAPNWTMTGDRAGTYTFEGVGAANTNYVFTQNSIRIDTCAPAAKVTQTCDIKLTHTEAKRGYEFQIDTTGSTSGSPNVPATVVVQLSGPTGAPIGQPITVGPDGHATVTIPRRHAVGSYKVTSTMTSPDTVVDCKRYGGSSGCEATDTIAPPVGGGVAFFVDGMFGKERRQRPISVLDDAAIRFPGLNSDTLFGQCSPLLGLKAGVAKRFSNDWEIAGDVGAAINVSTDDRKLRQTQMIADLEANRYFASDAFIGTGITFWDITRSETFTPGWLVHFGIPLAKDAKYPVFFVGEGRLFFDNIDNASSNYNFWGGIRVRFGRH
jgi:hypothetical protein